MKNVHVLARKYINNNVKMYNATLKTQLDVYPLIEYKWNIY